MRKKTTKIKSIDGLPAVGALIGVGVGVYNRLGVLMTLLLGSVFAGLGYYINNKFNQ